MLPIFHALLVREKVTNRHSEALRPEKMPIENKKQNTSGNASLITHYVPHDSHNALKSLYKAQVADAAATLLKRTYSLINLFSYSLRKRAAFTLAEVLITLGIIGVVAAMTMPSLINSAQKKELVAQYKKAYSVISQAYLMISNDNGGSLEGVFTSYNDYIDVFSKYIKNVKVCRINEQVSRCYLDSYKHLDGSVISTDTGSTLTTPDGATLRFYHINSGCTGTTELKKPIGCGRIRVDVNGIKKPNTVGYDIFDFYITQNGIIPRGHEDTTTKEDASSGYGRGITILTTGKIDY